MGGFGTASGGLPTEVLILDRWRHAGVDCAVGELRGLLYGFALLPGTRSGWSRYRATGRDLRGAGEQLRPERVGDWIVLEFGALERFWSQEVRARFTTSTGELSCWDRWGWGWALRSGCDRVNDFVDVQCGR